MVDNYPVASQFKSLVQVSVGDKKGARRTQENFLNETPIVGDGTYLIKLARGDQRGAQNTRRRVDRAWENTLNAVPLVGHAKGALHYSVNEKEEAREAFESANRATMIWTSGLFAGPAAPAAMVASALGYDALDSLVRGKRRGLIATVKNAIELPDAGSIVDAVASPALMAVPTANPVKIAMK